MTTKQIVLVFLVLYLLLMGVGGAVYYSIVKAPQEHAAAQAEYDAATKTPEQIEKERLAAQAKKEEEERLKREKEEEERRQREEEERKQKAERERLEKLREDIEAKMKIVTRGGVTFYTHKRGKEMSGVHLRPFIAEQNGIITLKHDIYYYSALDDANYGWIHGDHLDITADGVTYAFVLDGTKRHDKLGKGAEALTESYVFDADKQVIAMLKAVGNANSVTVRYYGGADISCNMSREDIRRINEMMTLYEIMEKEANGDI